MSFQSWFKFKKKYDASSNLIKRKYAEYRAAIFKERYSSK